jgi:hypothetical protein
MSKQEIILNNGQQAIINTDLAKIFVFNNRFENADYTNSGYDDVTLLAGTLMGRVSATQEIVPLKSDASDGSQFPIGVLNQTSVISGGNTVNLAYCVSGDVVEGGVILAKTGDTMNTVISGRSIRDRIGADTVGIKLVGGIEMTGFDNQ